VKACCTYNDEWLITIETRATEHRARCKRYQIDVNGPSLRHDIDIGPLESQITDKTEVRLVRSHGGLTLIVCGLSGEIEFIKMNL